MHKAVPAIAASAAAVTWLLHAQGAIDATATRNAGTQSAADTVPSARAVPAPPTTAPPTAAPTTPTRRRGGDDDDGPPAPRSSTTAAPPTTPPSTASTPDAGSGQRTVDGPTVENRYGPVQVEVVVSGGRITDVKALQYPSDARRSQSINAQALPLLKQEVLQAQNANIDGVSGATYTSEGYQQSLQAALDKAGAR